MKTLPILEKEITHIEQLFKPSTELLKAQETLRKSKYKKFLAVGGTIFSSIVTCVAMNSINTQAVEPMIAVSISMAGIATTIPMIMFVLPHFLFDNSSKKFSYQRALDNEKIHTSNTKVKFKFF